MKKARWNFLARKIKKQSHIRVQEFYGIVLRSMDYITKDVASTQIASAKKSGYEIPTIPKGKRLKPPKKPFPNEEVNDTQVPEKT